ncbi:MAG TPA: hypothetical protein VLL76_00175 [Candidatus Omnitrophota bacterium]|nr:hypothetical protein [Candidatus Omnitrophota bacterium]
MLISIKKTVSNKVHTAQVTVQTDALENEYFTAFGEPRIDLAGEIPFTPTAPSVPPGQITLDEEVDLGTPGASGDATEVAALDALEIKGAGKFPTLLTDTVGFFKHAREVVGDFEMRARIDYVDGGLVDSGADPTTNDGFRVGMALYDGDASDDPSIIFGWGAHQSAYNLVLWHRTAKDGAYSQINAIARSDFKGLFLRLVRESLTLKAYYSIDNGDTWNLMATTTLARQAYRVGLFINSGIDDELCTAVISSLSLTALPVEDQNIFTIEGGPNLAYMRSQSPHTFSIDGKVDPEAENKVSGWADEIKTRLVTAKSDLFSGNPAPSGGDETTIYQA